MTFSQNDEKFFRSSLDLFSKQGKAIDDKLLIVFFSLSNYRSNSSILGQRKKNQRKLKNKKRAYERRLSESENSETEDREKYRINSTKDNGSEDGSQDNVKPILNRDKLSENRKSDGIQIDKLQNNVNNHSHKTKRDKKSKDDANPSEKSHEFQPKNSAGTEFKNDLIFDLDI